MISPKLSFDFAGAILNPLITFTRIGATATVINSTGVIEPAAADTPRFDYTLNTGGVCKGLLLEEARTNIIQSSNDFSAAGWSVTKINGGTNPVRTAAAGTSPDGTNNATKVVFNTAASGDSSVLRYSVSFSPIPYSGSVFVKAFDAADVGKTIAIRHVAAGGFTLVTLTDSWQRAFSVETGYGTATDFFQILTRGGTTSIGTVSILLYGAQLEAGSAPTSYIPSSGGTATRNADVATITGTNFSDFWQASKGGAMVQAIPSTVSGIRPLVQYDDGTADNIIALRGNAADPELQIVDGGAPQVQLDAGTIVANTPYSLTSWWQTNDCKARLDSGAVVTDTSATIPTVTQARLGSDGTNYLNGHLVSISYYDTFSSQIYTRRKNKAVFSLL